MELGGIQTAKAKVRKSQLHKRMNWRSVWQIVQGFVGRQTSEAKARLYLDISRSQFYKLVKRWRRVPFASQVTPDWLYKRSATGSSRLPKTVQNFLRKELHYIKEESEHFKGHYNFAVLSDQCRQRYGKRYHRNTLRRWAMAQDLYHPDTDSTGKPCIRFEQGAIGMLLQHDTSHHAWLPLTGRHDALILTIDDHSRKVVGGKLLPRETAWHHLCVVRKTIETYGCPLSYYTDHHGIFDSGTETRTQFSRALATLDISLKLSPKGRPQARGKIEKRFDYFQRRIPYLCERHRITSLTQANKILDQEIESFNTAHIHAETQEIPDKRWNKALEEGRSLFKPIPQGISLDITFALHYTRVVMPDGTISFAGKPWKIPKAPIRREVTVVLRPPTSSRRPHTEIFVLYKGSTLMHFVLSKGNDILQPQ